MEFVADESADGHVVRALIDAGHQVHDIRLTDLGAPDRRVLEIAHAKRVILITEDKDFGDLVFAKEAAHSGVLLIRLDGLAPPDKVARVLMAISMYKHSLPGSFTVIDKVKVRVRTRD